jgi:MYXO-CTERM domain-containing protein
MECWRPKGKGIDMGQITTWTAACAVACAAASDALAGFAGGGVNFMVTSSAGSADATFSGTQVSASSWVWNGNWSANGASVSWTGVPVGWNGSSMSLGGNFVIRNDTASTQVFVIDMVLPGSFAPGTEWLVGGSAAASMVNLSPFTGSLSSTGPMWTAALDGNTVGSLFTNVNAAVDPFFTGSLAGQSFGNPIPGQTYIGGISSAARIRVSLSLTAGMEATLTSSFAAEVVPAPGALALLAVAAAGSRRRRR